MCASLIGGAACNEGSSPTTVGGGGTTSSATTGGPVAGTGSGGPSTSSSGAGAGTPQPCPGWPGWDTWHEVPYSNVRGCVPATRDDLPSPLGWTACSLDSGFNTGCRELDIPWAWSYRPFAGAEAKVEAEGVTLGLLAIAAEEPDPWSMHLYQRADGPTLSAYLDRREASDLGDWTRVWSSSISGTGNGHHIFGYSENAQEDIRQYFLGGSLSDFRPRVLYERPAASFTKTFSSGKSFFALWDAGAVEVADWPTGTATTVATSGQFGGQLGLVSIMGDFMVFTASFYPYDGRLVAFTPERGAYPFIEHSGGGFHSFSGFNTDGTDMVWIHSQGKDDSQSDWHQRDIMTAAHTEEAAAVQPRRLRSYPEPFYSQTAPFAVGCGHAAISYVPGHVIVLRLSDGYSWELPVSACAAGDWTTWCSMEPIALTCDELFFVRRTKGAVNVARVELAALGTPTPPD